MPEIDEFRRPTNRIGRQAHSVRSSEMWTCPKCREKVDDSFEVCWSCGTTPDGIEDPDFVTADEAEPIEDPPLDLDPGPEELSGDEFAGTPLPDLVECYMASNTVEAKFIADRLTEQGIPALADKQDINMVMGGIQPQMWGYGPRVRVKPEDLSRALSWLKGYEGYRKTKQGRDQE
jgi:hypothetical protein